MNHFLLKWAIAGVFLSTFAMAASNAYVSEIDKSFTVHKVGVLPVVDNVGGIYSRSVESKINELIKESHRFDLIEIKSADARKTIDDYEVDPEAIKNIGKKYGVDAVISARVGKKEKTIDIILDMFLTADGLLLSQDRIENEPQFEISDVERKTIELYSRVVGKLPYKALVLSRQGNRVTLDIGGRDGIRSNTIVSVEHIISAKRHPKFNFLLSTEKEIMGKIKIIKVDDTLSFGVVLQEKDRGVVGPDSKITGLDFVNYTESLPGAESLQPTQAADLGQNAISFGKNPKEWLPPRQPSFGRVGVSLGLGTYHSAISLRNAGSFSGDVPVYPQLGVSSEIWMTPSWYLGGLIQQGVMSVTNPQTGTPTKLGANTSHYDVHFGYKFLLQDDFWGPVINLHLGFAKYTLFIDASTPLTFTSSSYSGLYGGLGGSVPLSSDRRYYFDVNLDRYLFPSMVESPSTSGAGSDNSVTSFSFGGSYKMTSQFWVSAHLGFEFYSSTFTGTGSRNDTGLNASQSLTTLTSGIDYLF